VSGSPYRDGEGDSGPRDRATFWSFSEWSGWTPADLAVVVELAREGRYPNPAQLACIRKYTKLLPPQEINPLTVSDLALLVPRADEVASWDEEKWSMLLEVVSGRSVPDDQHMLMIWPVRSKQDLSIRRTRFRDSLRCYRENLELPSLLKCCRAFAGFDLISVVNFLNANWVLSSNGFNWFQFWNSMGAFSAGVVHFTAVARLVDDLVKMYPTIGVNKFKVAQSGVLTGYRNPPFPGFDPVAETAKLADGGGRRGLDPETSLDTFRNIAHEVLGNVIPKPVVWQSFHDFVLSGEWETPGSSSVGRVEWAFGEEKGHFKARKNLVPDVVDLEQLAEDCVKETAQSNIAIIKSELGKIRMAVASDMHTYLKMSWLTKLMGGAYLQWPGVVLEETAEEQNDRMIDMLKELRDRWCLPFDYAAFDHQPNTSELKAIVDVLLDVAHGNVPIEHYQEFATIRDSVLDGFDRATLTVHADKDQTFKVQGGLMSGLRWTSVLGNGWNTVMSVWVQKAMQEMGVSGSDIRRWILGDDSVIVTNSFAKTLLFRLGYQALGAEGSEGKFGIHLGQAEFLRVWYDSAGCHGYQVRSVPGLSQRKPWTSEPWSPESAMSQVYESLRILRRRGADADRCESFWRAVCHVWSQRNHVSLEWLYTPANLGGLGVCPWPGDRLPTTRWPRGERKGLVVLNRTKWRASKIQEAYQSWHPISDASAELLALDLTLNKVCADDVPSVNSALRAHATKPGSFHAEFRPPRWTMPGLKRLRSIGLMLQSLRPVPGSLSDQPFCVGSYGQHALLLSRWNDLAALYRVEQRQGAVREFCNTHIDFGRDLAALQNRGLTRREALDWLFGSMSIGSLTCLHPSLSSVLSRGVFDLISGFILNRILNRYECTQLVNVATTVLEAYLRNSELSRTVYGW
jgi:hypothetical protein